MGRVNKKKLSEYTESVEIEDKSSETGKESPRNKSNDDGIMDVDDLESVNDTSNKKSIIINIDADDDDSSLAQENEKNGNSASDNKAPKKRKAAVASAAAGPEKKKKDSAENDEIDNDSNDMALNGKSASNSPRKNKSKTAGKKGAKNAKKGQKPNDEPVPLEEEEDAEEEYEVKDIVDHKTERGISYFLIRWKGYTKADDTWEAEDTLSCPEIIEKYKKKISTTVDNKTAKKSAATPGSSKKGKRGGGATNKTSTEDDDKEWEVEKIIDYAEEKNGRVFRIRWKGFSAKNDTWEPEENLSCDDIIEKFMKSLSEQKDVSSKERKGPKAKKTVETSPRTNNSKPGGRKSMRAGNK